MLADRFDRLAQIADLHAALEAASEALAITPEGHPNERAILHNLATLYADLFRRLGDIRHLEAAVEAANEAVAVTPSDHRLRAAMLQTLANVQSQRFGRLSRSHFRITEVEEVLVAAVDAVRGLEARRRSRGHWSWPSR